MPKYLGTCPTCKKEMPAKNYNCPNCGESHFIVWVLDEEAPVVICPGCNGTCEIDIADEDAPRKIMEKCRYCEGTGAREGLRTIDLRTGELTGEKNCGKSVPRPMSWGPPSSSNSGCLVIVAALLSFACLILVCL